MRRGVCAVGQVFENVPLDLYMVKRTQVFTAQRQQVDPELESA